MSGLSSPSQPEPTDREQAGIAGSAQREWIAGLLEEQRQHWHRGERPPVERYVEEHPALGQNPGLVDLIYGEIVLREQRGEAPRLEEYLERFPEHANTLCRQFSVHLALRTPESPDPADDSGPARWMVDEGRQEGEESSLTPEVPTSGEWQDRGEGESDCGATVSVAVGRYRLERCVGRGGYGEVWRAFDPLLSQVVAIKRPRPDRTFSPDQVDGFLREARKVASLKHRCIVAVHNIDRAGASWYIVSDFIEGTSLAREMTRRRFTVAESARLIADIAEALQVAHLGGLVHRDVKPENILVDGQNQPYLTDFGLAISEEEQLDEQDCLAGTLRYMSPEQIAGKSQHLDGRSDLYSLGVVLYELLTGRQPFKSRVLSELREQILYREPRPLRAINETIPQELERICLKCLAKTVTDRYTTAADLAADLRRWLAHQDRPTASPTSSQERARKRAWFWMAVGVVGLALLVGVIVLVASGWVLPRRLAEPGSDKQTTPEPAKPPAPGKDANKPEPLRLRVHDPLGWIAQTEQVPRSLPWPGQHDQGGWSWDETILKALVVTSRDHHFLCLGEQDKDGCDLEVDIERPSWLGDTGVFFGYRVARKNQERRAEMQLIHLFMTLDDRGKRVLRIERQKTAVSPRSGSLVGPRAFTFRPVPGDRPMRLILRIRKGRLTDCLWDGQKLPELLAPKFEGDFDVADYQGCWGVYNQGGATWFRGLVYRPVK
jgi:serine/threonine protein kinase